MNERLSYEQKAWSLEDLYASFDSPELEKAVDELEVMISEFEAFRSKLTESIDEAAFLDILQSYEDLTRVMYRLAYYGALRFAADTQDQKAQAFEAKMRQRTAESDNRTMFFKLWWKALNQDAAERLMEASGDHRYWLEALRLHSPYTLSEAEEKIINLKDVNGPQAMVKLYDAMTNRYAFDLEVDGEKQELTRGELMVYVRSPDPDLRAAAYKELLRVYEREAPVLGQIYQYRIRDWRTEHVELRGYTSPIAVRNLANHLPDALVDMLLDVCRDNAGVFHRFFELKARWLGLARLRRYDIYAPVVASEKTYEYNEAVQLVLESFHRFDAEVANLAQRVFDEDHIDSQVRKGKISGAFCATVTPDLTPWVLSSYQGRPEDVATLAHELGHAVHTLLASDHSMLTLQPTLPLSETASTFGEMLLVDQMLDQEPSPEVQRDLLFRQMDDAYATIMRQAFFALFERSAHDAVNQGASVDELSEVYLENLVDQFGESLELGQDFRTEWTAIPHFYHTPFYVYAYAFGQLLVLSLYEQYRQQGEAFKPRYLRILRAGGSEAPIRVLEQAGIDVHQPEFWRSGFQVLERAVDRLEGLQPPS